MSQVAVQKPGNRYRFVTRELMAGIAVIAVLLAWALDHWRLTAACNKAIDESRKQTAEAKRLTDVLWGVQTTHTAQEEEKVLDAVGFGSRLGAGYGYDDAKTLADAIEVTKSHLVQDNKVEYGSLLLEERVKAAILAAIAGYDAKTDDLDKRFPGANYRANWEALKPKYLEIAKTGSWPPGASFSADYGLADNHATYDGLLLRLELRSESNGQRFRLPIIDLYYGRFE